MRGESASDALHSIGVCLEEVLLNSTGRDAKRAKSVQDWLLEASHLGHVWVDMERVAIAIQPVKYRLIRSGGLLSCEVRSPLGHRCWHKTLHCPFVAEASDTTNEETRLADGSHLLGIFLDDLSLADKQGTFPLVLDVSDALLDNVSLVFRQRPNKLDIFLTMKQHHRVEVRQTWHFEALL